MSQNTLPIAPGIDRWNHEMVAKESVVLDEMKDLGLDLKSCGSCGCQDRLHLIPINPNELLSADNSLLLCWECFKPLLRKASRFKPVLRNDRYPS